MKRPVCKEYHFGRLRMVDRLKITFGMGLDGAGRSGETSVGEITW